MAKKEKGLNKDKESIAKSDNLHQKNNQLSIVPIEKRIYLVRDTQVMIDLDLASLYDVENRSLRQAVRRNIDSFPEDFMFRLSQNEANDLIARGVSQTVIPPGYNTGGAEMFAFTEQGVAMLATVLKSPKARAVSIDKHTVPVHPVFLDDTVNDTVNVPVNVPVLLSNLPERQRLILSLIEKDDRITIEEIQRHFTVTRRTIVRDLAVLKQCGVIIRVGSDKTGSWMIVKKVKGL